MTEQTLDSKIRVTTTHRQGTGSIEFCIPKELCELYDLIEPTHIMLIPQDGGFFVTKLLFPVSEEDLKNKK